VRNSLRFAGALAAGLLLLSGLALAENRYGSIALSEKGTQYGHSTGHKSMVEAERAALAACGKKARDCKVFKSVENDCIGVAIAKNAAAGWATGGDSKENRQERAVAECKRQGGDVCTFATHFCAEATNP
jgi:Domain of unknown function (DUF4189)